MQMLPGQSPFCLGLAVEHWKCLYNDEAQGPGEQSLLSETEKMPRWSQALPKVIRRVGACPGNK